MMDYSYLQRSMDTLWIGLTSYDWLKLAGPVTDNYLLLSIMTSQVIICLIGKYTNSYVTIQGPDSGQSRNF